METLETMKLIAELNIAIEKLENGAKLTAVISSLENVIQALMDEANSPVESWASEAGRN